MFFKSKINPKKIKRANTKKLNKLGLKVIDHLPILDEPSFRSDEAVARRSLAMMAILYLGFNAPNEVIKEWLIDNNLIHELTDDEKRVLNFSFDKLDEQDQVNIHWAIGCLWSFTWMAGKHNKLSLNTGVGDSLASMFPDIKKNEPVDAFIENFKLRPTSELFSMLDYFYRAHWVARNNSLNGIKDDKVNMSIIMERRRALEWVCDSSLEWDKISLDT